MDRNACRESVSYLRKQGMGDVDFGLILGSGLGELADLIDNPIVSDYAQIPHFPISTVAGHAGKLIYGTLSNKKVLVMQGRFHYYEGNSMAALTVPVRVMKELGAHCNQCGRRCECEVSSRRVNADSGPHQFYGQSSPHRQK